MERRNSAKFLNARYWSCIVFFNIVVLAGFGLVLGKAFQLQVIEYPLWQERGRNQTETTLQVPTYRGSIYDRKGNLLSYSVPQRSLCATGEQAENAGQLAAQLAPILGEPERVIEKKLAVNRSFTWIKRLLTDQQAAAVEGLKAKGLLLRTEYKRFYPCRQVAGQVVGFVGLDGTGLEGIEKSFDQFLRQTSRNVEQFRDGIRKCAWLQPCLPPEPGESHGVRLTLDKFIQYLAECELEKTMAQFRAKAGEIVVLDPQNFEILAMANWPFFDPNLSDKKNADVWRNRAITDSFEPGSTFKVFLMSAALEEGIVKERDRVFCENGKCAMAGHVINDTHSYGWLTMQEVIKYSSNIGASKVALQLGGERYARYIQAFGFGQPTGINLPGEVKGLVRHTKKWRPIDLAATGFGQSIGVTALQLTQAIGCIANGGEYSTPLIAREILDSQGVAVKQADGRSPRRAIQKKTAQQMVEMMKLVTVEGGTGVSAVPEGYTVAGKTGTAQLLDPLTKRYASHKYTALFTGFVPADQPRLVITVVVHEPQGSIYGGIVSAPAFRNIAARALPYLQVFPAPLPSTPPASLPKGMKMASAEAAKSSTADASKIRPVSDKEKEKEKKTAPGSTTNVVQKEKNSPRPPTTVAERDKGQTCTPSVASAKDKNSARSQPPEKEKNSSRMPDVYGLSLKGALQKLASLGVQAKVQGSGKVVGQYPLVGAPLSPKTTVQLVLNEMN